MNKKYDLYALGNALVDIEYHVTPERLQQLQIDKGLMTLIEAEQLHKLMQELGESHEKMACGGSAANSVIALAQLGGSASFSGKLADDEIGAFYLQDLRNNHIHSNAELQSSETPSGVCMVFVTPDADRTMNTFLGITAELSAADVDSEALLDSQFLYLEGYLVTADVTLNATVQARLLAEQKGIKTAMTLSDPNMVNFFQEGLAAMIGDGVDVMFANQDEAFALCGCDELSDSLDMLGHLSKTSVITLGSKGVVISDAGQIYEIPAPKVEAIDTLGAGDMFAGAFLYGLSHGMSAPEAGYLATQAAAEVVQHFGPRLQREQTQAVLHRIKAS